MKIKKQLNDLLKVILEEAKANPQFEQRLERALLKETQPKKNKKRSNLTSPTKHSSKRTNKRAPAVIDPFDVFQEGTEALKKKLSELDIEKLKDIIAEFGMDQSKLARNWKKTDRLIEHIISIVQSRSKKGDAFRE